MHPNNVSNPYSRYFISQISFRKESLSNPWKILGRMFYSLEAKRKINMLLDENRIDIVHLHSIYHHISSSIIPEIKKRNIPIVMTVHDYHLIAPNNLLFHNGKICEITKPDKYYKALIHHCVKGSLPASVLEVAEKYFYQYVLKDRDLIDQFIVPSKFVKEKLHEYGISWDKLKIIPHFIDTQKYKPDYRLGSYLLFVGGLYPHKGTRFLIDIMERIPEINCYIIGVGSEEKWLKKIISDKKIKNIKLLGFVSDNKLKEYMQHCRFTIMPSLWYEGFGYVLIEANACGKPVIASNIGAIPEVIREGKNGILFKPNDVGECVSKICKLWNNSSKITKMGRNARKLVEQIYNPSDHYQHLLEIYQSVLR